MLELSVCIGSACHLKGSYNVIQTFQQMIEEYGLHDKIDLKANFCMRLCDRPGASVSVNGEKTSISPELASEFFREKVLPLVG